MARYIDADALKEKAHMIEIFDKQWVVDEIEIDLAPTADVVPVVHAKWDDNVDYIIMAYGHLDIYVCSNCHAHVTIDDHENYCPSCGAKMN